MASPGVRKINFLHSKRLQGVQDIINLRKGGNATYESADIFNQILAALIQVVENDITEDIARSPFVGVGTDESTDRSTEKHAVFVIRYIKLQTASLKTTFLKMKSIRDGKVETIFNALKDELRDKGVKFRRMVGFGADGANVMASDMNGVTGLIHQDNPYSVCIHCVCHRLHLAVSQACKNIPEMVLLNDTLSTLYAYISRSPNKLQKFKDFAELIGQKAIKLKRIFDIRWLSMGEAVLAVLKNYEPLVMMIEDEAATGDPTAIGLHQQMTTYLFIALLHLTADVLSATNHLSRVMQYRDVCFSVLHGVFDDCIEVLQRLQNENGTFMQILSNELDADPIGMFKGHQITYQNRNARAGNRNYEDVVNGTRQLFLQNLLNNLRARFPQIPLYVAMQIFEPASYPPEDRLLNWGVDYLEVLLEHYGLPKTNKNGEQFAPIIDSDVVRAEFLPFKKLVSHNRGEMQEDHFHFYTPTKLMEKIFGNEQQLINNFFLLLVDLLSLAEELVN
uniref:Zinc finger protein 862-like n=1 Tax=Saccoglossus kowalevskii TaxID=10224 RepID=A0ABM0MR57_SACKO|nr:PREDICTED: zinc finger protein 862-like [Saccoglossus kowalevskii]